jgi:hypothetical protein
MQKILYITDDINYMIQHSLVGAFSYVDNTSIPIGDDFETWHLSTIASTHSNLNLRERERIVASINPILVRT